MNSPVSGAPGPASSRSTGEVTVFLKALQDGDLTAAEGLLAPVYVELRKVATLKMAGERAGHTLQPTALVHEAWLRLFQQDQRHWKNRAHFFGAAAEVMRRVLVDRARRKNAIRHGGGVVAHEDISLVDLPIESNPDRLLRIHDVLDELAAEEPLRAEVVKLRFFVGMDNTEIALALSVSEKTVQRYWAYAKAWLQVALEKKE
ncbi:MAG: ECF-type sigma factor [Verrucomicrobiales bacterium]